MRQLKFRAWHKDSREMLYSSPENIFVWQHEGQPIEIMQFTGLLDRNSKEIYEGDIVKRSKVYKVSWSDESAAFVCDNETTKFPIGLYATHNDYEVTGNVFENKEC